jgi:hypothetical protein
MVMPTKKKSIKSEAAPQTEAADFFDKYRLANESDFRMGKSYLVVSHRGGEPKEVSPGEKDNLSKQAVKYAGLVARSQVVIEK